MAEVEATTIEELTEKIQNFCTSKTLRKFCSDQQEQPDHMLSFLKVLGIERLKREIKESFSAVYLQKKRFLMEFDTKMLILDGYSNRTETLTPEGLAKNIKRSYLFWAAESRKSSGELCIAEMEEYAQYVRAETLRKEVFDACALARRLREETLARCDTAVLDLQIWDRTGTAIVEVKAPNDRLMQSQKNTIELVRKAGERACLISVDEAK